MQFPACEFTSPHAHSEPPPWHLLAAHVQALLAVSVLHIPVDSKNSTSAFPKRYSINLVLRTLARRRHISLRAWLQAAVHQCTFSSAIPRCKGSQEHERTVHKGGHGRLDARHTPWKPPPPEGREETATCYAEDALE